jgi:hypothetical protein
MQNQEAAKFLAALIVTCVLLVFAIDTIFFAPGRERKDE